MKDYEIKLYGGNFYNTHLAQPTIYETYSFIDNFKKHFSFSFHLEFNFINQSQLDEKIRKYIQKMIIYGECEIKYRTEYIYYEGYTTELNYIAFPQSLNKKIIDLLAF